MKHHIEYGKREIIDSVNLFEMFKSKIKNTGYSLFSTASNPEEYAEYSKNAEEKIKGVDLKK